MSTREPHALSCPQCGHSHEVMLLKGMHITSLPEEQAQLIAGTLHQFTCPRCSKPTRVETSTLYTDFDRGNYVAVEPTGTELNEALKRRHQQAFDQAFTFGPDVAQELGAALRHRIVAGLVALREKVMIWDAGLDDRILEATKGDVQRKLGATGEEWRLAKVLTQGHLILARLAPAPRPPETEGVMSGRAHHGFHTIPAAVYQERLRNREELPERYPHLLDPWIVDIAASHRERK